MNKHFKVKDIMGKPKLVPWPTFLPSTSLKVDSLTFFCLTCFKEPWKSQAQKQLL